MGFDAVPDTLLPTKKTAVAAHERKAKPGGAGADESSLFFDDDKRVPVEVIAVPNPNMAQLSPEQSR